MENINQTFNIRYFGCQTTRKAHWTNGPGAQKERSDKEKKKREKKRKGKISMPSRLYIEWICSCTCYIALCAELYHRYVHCTVILRKCTDYN